MSFGSDKIAETINADAGVLALVDTFDGDPAIWFDRVVPEDFTPVAGKSYVNYYIAVAISGALEFGNFPYTINCRAEDNKLANAIQKAVFDAFNRKNPITGRGLFICSVLPTIPPKNTRDDYNAPVEVLLKTN